jgi:uncharacterized membrane protein
LRVSFYVFALLIGIVAGLRTFMPPAAVSLAAYFGVLQVQGTPFSFLTFIIVPIVFTILAVMELYADQTPNMMSRKAPPSFVARLISGAFCGAAIGATSDVLLGGLIVGVIGAVIGTLGGYTARIRLANIFGKDLPAALIEDVVAVGAAALIMFAVGR